FSMRHRSGIPTKVGIQFSGGEPVEVWVPACAGIGTERRMSKALEGVRILDLGHVQAAPTATQLLAWMGADVIKVEMPGRGDITRGQLQDVKGADSLYFTMLNSNKRSITINLKSPRGKAVIEELVRRSDIIV